MTPLIKKIYLIYTYKSKVGICAMCAQLDLEVMPKKLNKCHMFFMNFGVKKFVIKNPHQKNFDV
jgi:hypothetical protein